MSLPDQTPARKSRRLGLFLPFGAAILIVAGWSGAWLWASREATSRIDTAVADLAKAGYEIAWKDRKVGGYPFRLSVTLTDARAHEPSGWTLEAPTFEAEAFMHAPGHWMLATPAGLTFVRPESGAVAVSGEMIRASLTNLDKRPPNLSFQGSNLTFAPAPGARPFALSAAKLVEFHLRPGPDDEGGVFLKVDEGKARLSGLFAQVAGDKPVSIEWNSALTKMSAFQGQDWPAAVRAWSDAGGQIKVRRAGVTAGEAMIGATDAVLTVGTDGRLRGALPVTLRQAPRALGAMGDQGVIPQESAQAAAAVAQARQDGDLARANLTFEAGRVTLGPVALGPAPRLYDPAH